MGWPLNLSVIWRQAPRFFKGLTGYTYSEGTGPLEKSAALYQKALGATTGKAFRLSSICAVKPVVQALRACGQIDRSSHQQDCSAPIHGLG
jgi:hypothetical protein